MIPLDQKQPIPLDYADESVRLEERGPVPDGYLGYRKSSQELDDRLGDDVGPVESEAPEWMPTLFILPLILVLLIYLLVR